MRKTSLAFLLVLFLAAVPVSAAETPPKPILIGDLNSYTAQPNYTLRQKKGWQLALKEINANGGVLGRPLEVISRDEKGDPAIAIRVADDLTQHEGVTILMGCLLGNVCHALGEYADRYNVPIVRCCSPQIDASRRESDYAFAVNSSYTQALVLADVVAKQGIRSWSSVAPNYIYGRTSVDKFVDQYRRQKSDFAFISQDWPTTGKLDTGAEVAKLNKINPDAIYSVLFGTDLSAFVRRGKKSGLFDHTMIVSQEAGTPENLDPLEKELPAGWIVSGYPKSDPTKTEHQKFIDRYVKEYGESPGFKSLEAYIGLKLIAAAIEKAGTVNRAAIRDALEGLTIDTPIGPITMRKSDHISTFGEWIGKTKIVGNKIVFSDWKYYSAADYLPPEYKVKMKNGALP
jgi:branched-chain amino acid transport system substrate-binding protein